MPRSPSGLEGGTDLVAGSLGEEEYAVNAADGSTLSGFPWYQGDSTQSTPAIADLYDNGRNEIIQGGDSTQGYSYGTEYENGGHLRILSADGNLGQPEPNNGACSASTTPIRMCSRRRPSGG